jgi:hypothetical protein
VGGGCGVGPKGYDQAPRGVIAGRMTGPTIRGAAATVAAVQQAHMPQHQEEAQQRLGPACTPPPTPTPTPPHTT